MDLNRQNNQKGNILFLILIAVGLFAALSYTVSSLTRSSYASVGREQAEVSAAQILSYGAKLKTAIMRMRITNDCSDAQISFDSPSWDPANDYTNANAPGTYGCHIFDPRGGGVSWLEIPSDLKGYGTEYGILAYGSQVEGVGQTIPGDARAVDLLLLSEVNEQTCIRFNNEVGLPNPGGAPSQHSSFSVTSASPLDNALRFKGTFTGDANFEITEANGIQGVSGMPQGCFPNSRGIWKIPCL